MRRYPPAFDEAVLKHLEFVQANIDRMGRNSFFLKAWSVTLVAAIIALTARDPNVFFVLVALELARIGSLIFVFADSPND